MGESPTNGGSRKLRGPDGYCLDCFAPADITELKERVAELNARIERVATDLDHGAAKLHSIVEKFEILSMGFAEHLAEMSRFAGRVGTRKSKLAELKKKQEV